MDTLLISHRHTNGNKRCPTPFQYFPYTLMRQNLSKHLSKTKNKSKKQKQKQKIPLNINKVERGQIDTHNTQINEG